MTYHASHGGVTSSRTPGRWRCTRLAPLTLATAVGVSGCDVLDELVAVDAPSRIVAEILEEPGNAATLMASVVGDFECAFAQYVSAVGATTQEYQYATGGFGWRSYDQRDFEPSGFNAAYVNSTCSTPQQGVIPGVYKTLSTARWQADHFTELLETWPAAEVPGREAFLARSAAFSGYSHLLLGEAMCSAAFDVGDELMPPQIFELAVARFNTAITGAQAQGDAATLNMARIGRARALISLGRHSEANADAQQIPGGFVHNAGYSSISTRRENNVFVVNRRAENVTPEEYFRTIDDPRVRLEDQERLSPLGIPLFYQTKYPTASSPIPIARWEEAQLMIAEAELQAGNMAAAVAAINAVRTRPGVDLPPFESSSADEIRGQLLFERQVELFLEGHALGDIHRYDLPLVPPPDTPYPTGGFYGGDRCIPMPDVERVNNPNVPSS